MKLLTENLLVRYWKYMKSWKEHRNTIKQLNKLSDRELEDIGMTRDYIDNLIFREEDRKQRGTKT